MRENWVLVHRGYYAVSDLGRVRRVLLHNSSKAGGFLRASPGARGYCRVSLSIHQRITYHYVHHLVAEAFLGSRPAGFQINHIDGVKANNAAANLEYATPHDNIHHAIRLGLFNPRRKR